MNIKISTMRVALATAVLAVVSTLSSCGDIKANANTSGNGATQPDMLRFSVIPDWNKGKLAIDAKKLATMLSEKLGVEVRYSPSNDYTACVNGLIANKLDFVWLGGKTTCDAIDASKGSVHVLATRDIDLHFKSYFIGNADAVASGKVTTTTDLSAWQGKTADLRFTFGDVNSTSGHLMPRHFLVQAGIDPDKDFKSAAGYAQGGHSGTLKSVASGSVDCGALNFAYYDKAPAEEKAKAPILFTTPDYVDYAWAVHDRVGKDLIAKLQKALLGLDRSNPDEAAILDSWSAGAFLAAKDEQWHAIREVRDSLPKGFLTK
ncbi:MAG TPA: phosphate/phosphite/phosphonate ABC transporter substrate-binding protein [Planctomycetes bacterium]|nr:phosphate/phosphite/phosphonate ABC transporter substrate-binding protein [Planctomycetota bacterium]